MATWRVWVWLFRYSSPAFCHRALRHWDYAILPCMAPARRMVRPLQFGESQGFGDVSLRHVKQRHIEGVWWNLWLVHMKDGTTTSTLFIDIFEHAFCSATAAAFSWIDTLRPWQRTTSSNPIATSRGPWDFVILALFSSEKSLEPVALYAGCLIPCSRPRLIVCRGKHKLSNLDYFWFCGLLRLRASAILN